MIDNAVSSLETGTCDARPAGTYLINMIGVGGSALQEDGGDPDVDERAMSSE